MILTSCAYLVSKGIVDGHGGQLCVRSPGEGKGSTFTMRLPLEEVNREGSDLEMGNISIYNVQTKVENGQGDRSNFVNDLDGGDEANAYQFLIPTVQTNCSDSENNNDVELSMQKLGSMSLESVTSTAPRDGEIEKEDDQIFLENNLLRVLIVDDSTLNRKMTAKMFAQTATCDQAADGQIAVDMFMTKYSPLGTPSSAYDVILMDYQMPNMDGPTAIRELRRLGFSGLIFGLTGNAIECDKMEMMAAGADKVFIKPFDTGMFWEAVKTNWKH